VNTVASVRAFLFLWLVASDWLSTGDELVVVRAQSPEMPVDREETTLLRPRETKYVAHDEVATMFVVLSSFSRGCSALFGLVCQPRGCGAGWGWIEGAPRRSTSKLL